MMLPTYMRATGFRVQTPVPHTRTHLHARLGCAVASAMWGFLQNGSTWFLASNSSAKPTYQNFATDWNLLLAAILLFAVAGAALRTWGAAYLGANTVHRGGMEGDRMVASGPYRYTRNPLYLGTILNTVAVCMLMRPDAAIVTLLLSSSFSSGSSVEKSPTCFSRLAERTRPTCRRCLACCRACTHTARATTFGLTGSRAF